VRSRVGCGRLSALVVASLVPLSERTKGRVCVCPQGGRSAPISTKGGAKGRGEENDGRRALRAARDEEEENERWQPAGCESRKSEATRGPDDGLSTYVRAEHCVEWAASEWLDRPPEVKHSKEEGMTRLTGTKIPQRQGAG